MFHSSAPALTVMHSSVDGWRWSATRTVWWPAHINCDPTCGFLLSSAHRLLLVKLRGVVPDALGA